MTSPSEAQSIAHWRELLSPHLCVDAPTYERVHRRLLEGRLTREENPVSHFCVYFLPVNPVTKQVFLVHHKKANQWLSPGGHLDIGERPEETVNREIEEELGVPHFFKTTPQPFLFSIVDIVSDRQTCKTHHDLWYVLETDGHDFRVDPEEFHETRWLTFAEARALVTDPSNIVALAKIEKQLSAP